MKRNINTLAGVLLVFVIFGQTTFLAWADDFSFIGINWNDSPNAVIEKVNKSSYAGIGAHWSTDTSYVPISSDLRTIVGSRMIDEDKYEFLSKVEKGWMRELQLAKDSTVKTIEFEDNFGGKSMVKEGRFYFSYKEETLLGYTFIIRAQIAKVDEDTGEGQFYQSLIEKYGKPKTTKRSRVWSKNGQTLYYMCAGGGTPIVLVYVSEKNLSSYITSINTKIKILEGNSKKQQSGAVRKDF
jgi:hypothetical protein